MQIERNTLLRIPDLYMRISGKYRQLAGRIVQVDAQDRKSGSRHHAIAESHAKVAGLIEALKLEIAQTALHRDLCLGSISLSAKNRDGHGATGRDASQAAIQELHLSTSIGIGDNLRAFEDRRIGNGGVGKHLIALHKPHLSIDTAQARCLCTLFSSQTRRQQNRNHTRPKDPESLLPVASHGSPPFLPLRPRCLRSPKRPKML